MYILHTKQGVDCYRYCLIISLHVFLVFSTHKLVLHIYGIKCRWRSYCIFNCDADLCFINVTRLNHSRNKPLKQNVGFVQVLFHLFSAQVKMQNLTCHVFVLQKVICTSIGDRSQNACPKFGQFLDLPMSYPASK